MYTVFLFGVLYPDHSQLAFDFVVIACSLDSIRPGLVQGCKAPNVVGCTCLITSLESTYPTEHGLYALSPLLPGLELMTAPIGPSWATSPLLIGVVLSLHREMWVGVTNISYDSRLTSLGIVWMQIHCIGRGSVANKSRTSRCPSVSVSDITYCATSPTFQKMLLFFYAVYLRWLKKTYKKV